MKWTKEEKEKAIEIILDRTREGESIRQILGKDRDEDLPSRGRFYTWMNEDKDLQNQYARAATIKMELAVDEMRDIAQASTPETYQAARLEIDVIKWSASKMIPKKYGDKLDVTTGGDKIREGVANLFPTKEEFESED